MCACVCVCVCACVRECVRACVRTFLSEYMYKKLKLTKYGFCHTIPDPRILSELANTPNWAHVIRCRCSPKGTQFNKLIYAEGALVL